MIDGAADADRQADGGLRRRVVQRRRRQVDHALAVAPQPREELEQRQRLVRRVLGQRPDDALRPAGRARRVQHRRARAARRRSACRVADVGRRRSRRNAVVVAPSPSTTRHSVTLRALAHRLHAPPSRLARDVISTFDSLLSTMYASSSARQVRVDAGVVEAGALAGPARLEVAAVVLHEDRVVVEALEAVGAQEMGEPVGARLVLA